MTLADRITDIVRRYHTTPADTTDIIGLIDMRIKLTTLLFGFGREVGELYHEKNGAEFRRRSAESKKHLEFVLAGESSAKAAQMARDACEEQYKEEAQSDAVYRSAYLILSQGNEVCACLAQHIANVRQEHRQEMSGQGSQG